MDGALAIGFLTLGTALVVLGGAGVRAQRRDAKRRHSRSQTKDPRIARMQRSVAADAPTEVIDMDALREGARIKAFDGLGRRQSAMPPPVPVATLKPGP